MAKWTLENLAVWKVKSHRASLSSLCVAEFKFPCGWTPLPDTSRGGKWAQEADTETSSQQTRFHSGVLEET
eukprot:3187708-Lingulodinium_polyedra.AAC.1